MRLAITGATGFVGSHLVEQAIVAGHEVKALTRRHQPVRTGLTWIEGALDNPVALDALCSGCDAIVHVAGVINGSAESFRQGNVIGTENVVAAAADAGIERFIHISSLAAREPELSVYGRSKSESEEPVIAAGRNWTIIRPPAIYGPRDREMLELFRVARYGIIPLPPGGRASIIHIHDLCRLILACLEKDASHGRTYEPDDGHAGGWTTVELAKAIGRAVGRNVLPLPTPKRLLLMGVKIDTLMRGDRAKLTRDRVEYLCHPNWTVTPQAIPPANVWRAEVPTEEGLAATARWYRAEGWL